MEAARASGGRRGGRLAGEDGRGVPAAALPHHGPVGRRPARVPAHLSALQEPPGKWALDPRASYTTVVGLVALLPGTPEYFHSYDLLN